MYSKIFVLAHKVGFKRLRAPIEKNCDKSGKQNLLITQQIPLPKQLKIAS